MEGWKILIRPAYNSPERKMEAGALGFTGFNPAYRSQLLGDGTGAVPYGGAIRRKVFSAFPVGFTFRICDRLTWDGGQTNFYHDRYSLA